MKDNHQAIAPDDCTDLCIHAPRGINGMEDKMAKGKFCSIVLRGAGKQHLRNSICSDRRIKSLLNLSFGHGSNQLLEPPNKIIGGSIKQRKKK